MNIPCSQVNSREVERPNKAYQIAEPDNRAARVRLIRASARSICSSTTANTLTGHLGRCLYTDGRLRRHARNGPLLRQTARAGTVSRHLDPLVVAPRHRAPRSKHNSLIDESNTQLSPSCTAPAVSGAF